MCSFGNYKERGQHSVKFPINTWISFLSRFIHSIPWFFISQLNGLSEEGNIVNLHTSYVLHTVRTHWCTVLAGMTVIIKRQLADANCTNFSQLVMTCKIDKNCKRKTICHHTNENSEWQPNVILHCICCKVHQRNKTWAHWQRRHWYIGGIQFMVYLSLLPGKWGQGLQLQLGNGLNVSTSEFFKMPHYVLYREQNDHNKAAIPGLTF